MYLAAVYVLSTFLNTHTHTAHVPLVFSYARATTISNMHNMMTCARDVCSSKKMTTNRYAEAKNQVRMNQSMKQCKRERKADDDAFHSILGDLLLLHLMYCSMVLLHCTGMYCCTVLGCTAALGKKRLVAHNPLLGSPPTCLQPWQGPHAQPPSRGNHQNPFRGMLCMLCHPWQ